MDSPKNGSGTSPFKIFSMLRVKVTQRTDKKIYPHMIY
jgi:hypothetical protein